MPGKWRSDNSPWVKALMEDFANNAIRQITVLCSAQSAKTETILALLNWIIAEDASPTMWVTSSDEEALKFANERLMPSLRMCPPVAKQIPDNRTLAKNMENCRSCGPGPVRFLDRQGPVGHDAQEAAGAASLGRRQI